MVTRKRQVERQGSAMNDGTKDLAKRYQLIWYVPGMLLFVVGMILWSVPAQVDEVPYQAMLTGTICLSFGCAFLGVLPLWKRIAKLEEHVSHLKQKSEE